MRGKKSAATPRATNGSICAAGARNEVGHHDRPGASGEIAYTALSQAKPDGYTLLTTEMSFSIAPSLIPTLPFDARTLLIEDTRYTDGDALDRAAFRQGVLDYARAQGWPNTLPHTTGARRAVSGGKLLLPTSGGPA